MVATGRRGARGVFAAAADSRGGRRVLPFARQPVVCLAHAVRRPLDLAHTARRSVS